MSATVIVCYQTQPEEAEENARLVEGVFASLAEVDPGGLTYTTYRLADGVTFVNVAHLGTVDPLATLPAFAQLPQGVSQPCVQPPVPREATVGAHTARTSDPAGSRAGSAQRAQPLTRTRAGLVGAETTLRRGQRELGRCLRQP